MNKTLLNKIRKVILKLQFQTRIEGMERVQTNVIEVNNFLAKLKTLE